MWHLLTAHQQESFLPLSSRQSLSSCLSRMAKTSTPKPHGPLLFTPPKLHVSLPSSPKIILPLFKKRFVIRHTGHSLYVFMLKTVAVRYETATHEQLDHQHHCSQCQHDPIARPLQTSLLLRSHLARAEGKKWKTMEGTLSTLVWERGVENFRNGEKEPSESTNIYLKVFLEHKNYP